jgi:putative ABC transport system permease protein
LAALGCLLSLWGSRLIQALLFHTEFRDPSVLATSILALLFVTALAAWMPARRASRIEPAIVLREG